MVHPINISMLKLVTYINNFGLLAPAIAFGLFVIQAVFPVFPYILLATAGGVLFGFKLGFILSWLGALTGACIAYGLCRLFNSTQLSNKLASRFSYNLNAYNSEMAFWSIIIARVIPVVPTPLINVAAAIGGVSFWTFFFSSAIGKIPSAALYTGLGLCLFRSKDIKLTLFLLAIIIILTAFLRFSSQKKHNMKSK